MREEAEMRCLSILSWWLRHPVCRCWWRRGRRLRPLRDLRRPGRAAGSGRSGAVPAGQRGDGRRSQAAGPGALLRDHRLRRATRRWATSPTPCRPARGRPIRCACSRTASPTTRCPRRRPTCSTATAIPRSPTTTSTPARPLRATATSPQRDEVDYSKQGAHLLPAARGDLRRGGAAGHPLRARGGGGRHGLERHALPAAQEHQADPGDDGDDAAHHRAATWPG